MGRGQEAEKQTKAIC